MISSFSEHAQACLNRYQHVKMKDTGQVGLQATTSEIVFNWSCTGLRYPIINVVDFEVLVSLANHCVRLR